jgi:hypothetical protein
MTVEELGGGGRWSGPEGGGVRGGTMEWRRGRRKKRRWRDETDVESEEKPLRRKKRRSGKKGR